MRYKPLPLAAVEIAWLGSLPTNDPRALSIGPRAGEFDFADLQRISEKTRSLVINTYLDVLRVAHVLPAVVEEPGPAWQAVLGLILPRFPRDRSQYLERPNQSVA